MKKTAIVILTLALSLSLLACEKKEETSLDEDPGTDTGYASSGEEYRAALRTDLNADIMIYGEEQELNSDFEVRRIDKLSEEAVNEVSDYGYQAIVIMDRGGTISLTDEDFDFLWDYTVNQDKDFIYIGKQYIEKLNNDYRGLVSDDDLGIGVYGCFPDDESVIGVGVCAGVWNEELENEENSDILVRDLTDAIASELYFNATGESYQ